MDNSAPLIASFDPGKLDQSVNQNDMDLWTRISRGTRLDENGDTTTVSLWPPNNKYNILGSGRINPIRQR